MSPLNEQEVEDLLGAYALGALAEADMQRVQEHLASCDRHAQIADQLGRVTPALALSVEDRDPSPELRGRILAALESPARISPLRPTPRQRMPRLAPLVAAAAIVLLVAGIAIGRLTAPQPAPAQVTTWIFHGNAQAPNAVARLVYFRQDHRAAVEITGLKPLTAGQVYEMWLFQGNSPIASGVSGAPGGALVAQLGDLTAYSQFAVTVEPGQQPKPTSNPILIGKLDSSGATS